MATVFTGAGVWLALAEVGPVLALAGPEVVLAAVPVLLCAGKVPVVIGGFTGVEVVPPLLLVTWLFPAVALPGAD